MATAFARDAIYIVVIRKTRFINAMTGYYHLFRPSGEIFFCGWLLNLGPEGGFHNRCTVDEWSTPCSDDSNASVAFGSMASE